MRLKDRKDLLQSSEINKLTAIDVFAGGGGLTVGLKRSGFKVVGAVELERHAFSTYKSNHPEVHAFRQDVRTVKGELLSSLSPNGEIDLLAGCPPCQGFSSLTSKYDKVDPRNDLVMEMARLIVEIRPRAVMMENVPGLLIRGKNLFEKFLDAIRSEGYVCDYRVLQVADYGVPQSRRRLVLLAGKGFQIPIPNPTHSQNPKRGLKPWRTIDMVIKKMPHPVELKDALAQSPQAFNWHIVRTLSSQNKRRLEFARQGKSWSSIPKRLRPVCHQDRSAGFSNVYGRMTWDQVAPTVTGGCTTFSKGRFGHPDEDRTISVREAALIQTFPADYIIDTPYMEYACNIIGNALPCDFAEILAQSVHHELKKQIKMAPSR
jgi:DNA (cytosine-5)-methyltransferase 1